MNPWQDGLSALANRAPTTFILIFAAAWGIFTMRGILLKHIRESFDEADALSLSAAGWALPVLILALTTFTLSSLINAPAAGIFALLLILLSIFNFKTKLRPGTFLIAAAVLTPILILRFAFIRNLPLPSYFDSAEHYRLIRSLLETYQTGSIPQTTNGGYYHPGYHHILAPLAHFFNQDIAGLMLVSGPLLLALLPFTFYFPVKRQTGSVSAALFTCLLAGFGFHMPAHLMNWGKYPALLSLFFIPFVLSIIQILHRNDTPKKRVLLLLAAVILASTLIHSRTFILYSLLLPAALLAYGWKQLSKPYRIPGFVLLFLLLAAELIAIQQNPALKTLLEGYLENDPPILIFLTALILFSAYQFPHPSFFLLSWLTLCFLCLFIPITLPTHGAQTLLDRPFAQMFAFIPLSLLAGLGLSSLIHTLARLHPNRMLIQRFATILPFGFVLLNAALNYNFHPSDCCRFVTRDDLAALAWLDQTTSPDAKTLVAATGLYVTSLEPPQTQTGVDAGIWIPPLLSRPIQLSGADIQFDLAETHNQLCSAGVDYIYIGGASQSFDPVRLESHPGWYKPAFILPSAKAYQLTGCK